MKRICFSLCLLCLLLVACKEEPTNTSGDFLSDNPALANTTTENTMPKSKKRGVSFKISTMQDAFLLSNCISWFYNWANTNPSMDATSWLDANDIDFCPMCWNGNYSKDAIRQYVKEHPNTKYLLGFNEPNLTDQANMKPDKAAELWPDVLALAKELNLKLGAPALNYGTLSGYSDPVKWLREFTNIVGADAYDFIPLHCYMTNCSGVQGMVNSFDVFNKPIWMTEFCAWEIGSVETQKTYMASVLNYFESCPKIERYAWFMPRMSGSLNSKPYNQLLTKMDPIQWTPLGEIFNGMSSLDKSVCITSSFPIPAHWYTDFSDVSPCVTNSTDTIEDKTNKLMVYNFMAGRYMQYQVDCRKASSQLNFRYATSVPTILLVYIDGKLVKNVNLPTTGGMSKFSTYAISNVAIKGKHYVRFEVQDGTINFSWFQFK